MKCLNDNNYFKGNLFETFGIILFMLMYALIGIYYLPFNLLFFPIAFIFLGVRKGLKQSVISIVVVSLLIGLVVDISSGILLFILFMPVTAIIVYGIKTRKKPVEVLVYSTVAFFIATLLLYGYTQKITGISIVNQMQEYFNNAYNIQVQLFEEMGLTNFEILKNMEILESNFSQMLQLFPVLLIMISMFISYCNYYISILALRKSGIGIVSIPRFSKFKLPTNVIPGILVMFLGVFLIKGMNLPYYETIFLNIIALVGYMFVLQGLSVMDYFLIKLRVKIFLRILIIFLTTMTPLGTAISLIGIGDIIFDFRKIKKLKS